jgi:hypothetical protein
MQATQQQSGNRCIKKIKTITWDHMAAWERMGLQARRNNLCCRLKSYTRNMRPLDTVGKDLHSNHNLQHKAAHTEKTVQ